jgi:SAM-dependent MidA family methyltransferase
VHIVEVGAGNGALAETVLTSLPWHFRVRCHYHIVEKSEALTAVQKERLERLQRFPGPRISWHPDMDSVLRKTSRFILFSNELVDAFPASVFRWAAGADISGGGPGNTHDPGEKGRWDKLFLRIHENGLFEEFQPVSHYELADLTSIFDPGQWPENAPPHGQRCEVHFSYREWLHAWVPRSRCVSMLTIDYGDIMPAIYHRKPGGTMRAYFRHNHLTGADVYSNMGGQDLTCDVNFSDLIQWGLELDLESQPLMTQAEFLDAFGDPYESSAGVDPGAAAASSFLRMEEGAGSAFKVLVQRRTTPNT